MDAAQAAASWSSWHERLGHPSEKRLRKTLHLVDGAAIDYTSIYPKQCTTCDQTKITKPKYSKQTTRKRAKKAGTHFHSDIQGPFRVRSYQNSRYWAVLVDDKSRYKWPIFLSNKNHFTRKFKILAKQIATIKGVKLQLFQTDQAGEYTGNEFQALLQEIGCRFLTSCTGQSQQNPVAERAIKTVSECGRTLLLGAKFPFQYWEDAFKHACLLQNIVHSSGTIPSTQTPYEAFYGKTPNISDLPTFGAPCMFHVPKTRRHKLEPSGREGRFLGFSEKFKGYKVLDIKTRSIYHVAQAKFYTMGDMPTPDDLHSTAPIDLAKQIMDPVESKKSEIVDSTKYLREEHKTFVQKLRHDYPNYKGKPSMIQPILNNVTPNTGSIFEYALPPSTPVPRAQLRRCQLARKAYTTPLVHTSIFCAAITLDERLTPFNDFDYGDEDAVSLWMDNEIKMKYISQAFKAKTKTSKFPNTYREAKAAPDGEEWITCTLAELKSHLKNGTWAEVILPPGAKTIGCRWVYVIKFDENGDPVRYKARLVAQGFTQRAGINFDPDQVYAPVASYATIRTLLALGVELDCEIEQFDIETAYLNSTLEEQDIYLRLPEGYDELLNKLHEKSPNISKGKRCLRLKKTIYGLKQSGRKWNNLFVKKMKTYGYERLISDSSVFIRRKGANFAIIVLYVDDIVGISSNVQMARQLQKDLCSTFTTECKGELKWLLGMKIDRDRKAGTMTLSQPAAIEELLRSVNFCSNSKVDTPMFSSEDHIKKQIRSCPEGFNPRAVYGSLLFLSVTTRFDVSPSVAIAGQYLNNPEPSTLYTRLKRILKYLQAFPDAGITFTRSGKPLDLGHLFRGFADASLADCIRTRRSRTGIVLKFGPAPIIWVSKRQSLVAHSTAEAEYVAASTCNQLILGTRHMFQELGFDVSSPTPLHEDNEACIALATNPVTSRASKHIELRYHSLREHVALKHIKMIYTPTKEQQADFFTKPLNRMDHRRLLTRMNLFL